MTSLFCFSLITWRGIYKAPAPLPPSALFIPATMTPPSKSTLFATRKRKGEASGSPAPQSKRVRQWESMQTGLDAAKLRIMVNHWQRKKRALDVLQATQQYKGMSSAERKATEAEVIAGFEARGDADFKEAAQQWKAMNRIADNDDDDNDDDKSTSEDWESPDENEPDVSDPEFEVDETIAAKEGVPYEFNDDGQLNLGEGTTAVLRHILERARKQQEILTE